jgi:hypothetical protein
MKAELRKGRKRRKCTGKKGVLENNNKHISVKRRE